MRFEWNEAKRAANLAKHGIDFVDALEMFAAPMFVRSDERKDYGERRTAVKKISSKTRSKTNWTRVDSLSDRDIDYSDIPELDKDFFKSATLVLPEPKTTVTIRLDQQVLEWFKAKGPGYQTRINALLRAYMEAHKS